MAPTWKTLPEAPKVPARLPDGKGGNGTLGKPIELYTNHFPVQFSSENLTLYHYDVTIDDYWNNDKEQEKKATDGSAPGAAKKEGGPHSSGPEGGATGGGGGGRKKKKGRKKTKGSDGEGASGGAAAGECEEAPVPSTPFRDSAPTNQTNTPTRRIPKYKLRIIFGKCMEKHPNIFKKYPFAFDGEKNAYSSGIPPQLKSGIFSVTFSFVFESEQREKCYKVTFKTSKPKGHKLQDLLQPLRAGHAMPAYASSIFQMLEVMINYQRSLKYETVGRNKFFSMHEEFYPNYSVGGGKQGMVGFFSSLRPARGWKDAGQLMLNVDVAHCAFYKPMPLLDFLAENLSYFDCRDGLNEAAVFNIKKLLVKQSIKVQTTHTQQFKRKYKVIDIGRENCLTHKFDFTEGSETSKVNIVQYFWKRYKYPIKYPHLPCLVVPNGSLIPMEVCEIVPGQRVKGKLSDRETAEFIKQTAVPPAKRLDQIRSVIAKNQFNLDPCLEHMGVQISQTPLQLTGRVLPAPDVHMQNTRIEPRQGVWDARSSPYHRASDFSCWAVVDYSRMRLSDLEKFLKMLVRMGAERGMRTAEPQTVIVSRQYNPQLDFGQIRRNNPKVTLVMCVLGNDSTIYKLIKSIGDREFRLITQCVQRTNVLKCQAATVGNILLKINAKLGGVNHVSAYTEQKGPTFSKLFGEPVMVMGADVNHPPVSDLLTPSLVAVVGSFDRNASLYALEVRHQQHRTEIIQDMKNITVNLLKNFIEKTKFRPQRLIMYRDGVSETQFTQVLAHELKEMREACGIIGNDYRPAMTFVCVQKRHHTRLFCQNPRDAVGRAGNVPPGTVVDSVITHRTEADFYLCSHQGIQGTSKPSHYHMLWDDNDFTMNQLQLLTYSLCHNYSRCCRSVSIPTPAYYAHLAAFRAKVHLEGTLERNRDTMSIGSGEQSYSENDLVRATRVETIDQGMGLNMFYI